MNAELQSLGRRLVGRWTTEATHPALPGTVISGSSQVEWLEGEGGIAAIEKRNIAKAKLLYDYLDGSRFYINPVRREDRSRMNVPFRLHDESLDEAFLKGAKERGMIQLKGHRSVGGMRASIYNAMPVEGVQALVDYMGEFERRHG